MSWLGFQCDFQSMEMQSLTLPVEIRKPNYALVKRALSHEQVELPPGTYLVSAQTPGGQQLTGEVTLGPDETQTVVLRPDPEDAPDPGQEVPRYVQQNQMVAPFSMFRQTRPREAPPGGGAGGPPPAKGTDEGARGAGDSVPRPKKSARLVLYRGNPLVEGGGLQPVMEPELPFVEKTLDLQGNLTLHFDLPPHHLIQLAQAGRVPVNAVLPSTPGSGGYAELRGALAAVRPSGEGYSLEVFLRNVRSESLVRFSQYNQMAQTSQVSQNSELQEDRWLLGMVEEGVKDKIRDPLTAAAGAYTLLRLNDLERLHKWTLNLMNWFPWLPDGIPIYAEHMARLGRHAEALEAMRRLAERGLPFFSDGLSYAVDRLRFYRRSYLGGPEDPAVKLLERLKPFAAFADFSQPILTFTGADPNRPSAEPLSGLPSLPGMDV